MPAMAELIMYSQKDFSIEPYKLDDYIYYFQRVLEVFPNHADVYGMLGYCYYYRGEIEKAVVSYQKAIKLNPHNFLFPYNLGAIFYGQENFTEAKNMFRVTLSINPARTFQSLKSSRIYQSIILSADIKGQDVGASVGITNDRANKLIILCYYHLKDFSELISHAVSSIAENRSDKEFYYYFAGVSFYEFGNYKEAVNAFRECLKVKTNYYDASEYLAEAFRQMNKHDAAEKFSKDAKFYKSKTMPGDDLLRDFIVKIF